MNSSGPRSYTPCRISCTPSARRDQKTHPRHPARQPACRKRALKPSRQALRARLQFNGTFDVDLGGYNDCPLFRHPRHNWPREVVLEPLLESGTLQAAHRGRAFVLLADHNGFRGIGESVHQGVGMGGDDSTLHALRSFDNSLATAGECRDASPISGSSMQTSGGARVAQNRQQTEIRSVPSIAAWPK